VARAPLLALCVALVGCGSGGDHAKPARRALASDVRFTSPDFKPGGRLPKDDTCDGTGRKPLLNIAAVPRGARALALIMHDPDAPGGDFTHWTLYDISPSAKLPSGSEGLNELGKPGYTPACPPNGDKPHHYVFELYALRKRTGLPKGARPGQVRAAADRLAFARGVLVATYSR
jgi:Raf kinase inhibitor-like YbhB/YbcL family protein